MSNVVNAFILWMETEHQGCNLSLQEIYAKESKIFELFDEMTEEELEQYRSLVNAYVALHGNKKPAEHLTSPAAFYNKAELIKFLEHPDYGPAMGGRQEVQWIEEQFEDMTTVPAIYVYNVFSRLYGRRMESELKLMEANVTGYGTLMP